MLRLEAKKLAFLGKMPNELDEDAPSFAAQFIDALAEAASFHLDDAFLNGAGGSKPMGIVSAAGTVEVAKETGQAAATIVYPNLAKMYSRLLPASRQNAVWVCSNTCIPESLQVGLAVGAGGSPLPVLSESHGQFRMRTRPVVFTEKLPGLGTAGDIMLCDFSQYAVGLRVGVSLAVSGHSAFTSDQQVWRLRMRVDGKPLLGTSVTPKNGDALSAFVKLATRA